MSTLIPKKVGNLEYKIEPDSTRGMRVPIIIYANEQLLEKMLTDRTIQQAINVSTLPGIVGNVVVLPDGHEGYGFPVGGVAAMDANDGVISPGGVGYDINGDPTVDKGQLLISTALTTNNPATIIVKTGSETAIPADTPASGSIRVTDDNGFDRFITYASWTGTTFTLTGDAGDDDDFSVEMLQ